MEQVHFRGKVPIVCKRSERIYRGMDDDAWYQAPTAIKDRDQQESNRDGKNDLAQVIDKIHAAAVEQVDDMPDTKSHTGDNNGGFDIILCNGLKQKPPEDYFLQKSNTEHTYDTADRFHWCVIEGKAVPEISRCQDNERHIVEESTCGNG